MKAKILIALMAIGILFSGCRKDEPDNQDTTIPSETITGSVILPDNTSYSTDDLEITSLIDSSAVVNDSYDVTVPSEMTFQPLFVLAEQERVVLMGYHYPGQTQFSIDSRSTALAYFMSNPFFVEISEEGMILLINQLQQDANFEALVDEVEKVHNAGKDLLDTTNTDLIQASANLFLSVSAKSSQQNSVEPLRITASTSPTKKIRFVNNNRSHKTVIGIYKNGQQIKQLTVDEEKFFANSLGDLANQIWQLVTTVEPLHEAQFNVQTDGDYTIKARTGVFGFNDQSPEIRVARKANIIAQLLLLIEPILSVIPGNECITSSIEFLVSSLYNASDFDDSDEMTSVQITGNLLALSGDFTLGIYDVIEECAESELKGVVKKTYLVKMALLIKLQTAAMIAGGTLNLGTFIAQWIISEPAMDSCFSFLGTTLSSCQLTASPVANFSASQTSINVGETINFTDQSTNSPTSWQWIFEDGSPSSSTQQNPSVTYNSAGTFNVTLTTSNSNGTDSETKTGYIIVNQPGQPPIADFSASQTSINVGGTINFTDQSTNSPTSWQWVFQDGSPSSSTQQNPSVTYNSAGTYNVTLTATNSDGSDSETKSGYITVTNTSNPIPITPTDGCSAAPLMQINQEYTVSINTSNYTAGAPIDGVSAGGNNVRGFWLKFQEPSGYVGDLDIKITSVSSNFDPVIGHKLSCGGIYYTQWNLSSYVANSNSNGGSETFADHSEDNGYTHYIRIYHYDGSETPTISFNIIVEQH